MLLERHQLRGKRLQTSGADAAMKKARGLHHQVLLERAVHLPAEHQEAVAAVCRPFAHLRSALHDLERVGEGIRIVRLAAVDADWIEHCREVVVAVAPTGGYVETDIDLRVYKSYHEKMVYRRSLRIVDGHSAPRSAPRRAR